MEQNLTLCVQLIRKLSHKIMPGFISNIEYNMGKELVSPSAWEAWRKSYVFKIAHY